MKLDAANKIRFNILLMSLIFGTVSWIFDAIIDYFFFFEGTSFQNVFLIHLTNHMTFERIMIIVTFLLFGIFVSHLVLSQRKVEKNLEESEERFKRVADIAQDWEYWITKDRNLSYVSPSSERITGYKPTEFIKDKKLLESIIHPDDREKFIKHTNESLCEVDLDSFEFRIKSKNNKVKWIEHSCQSVYDSKGKYLGHRTSNRDITLRKTAEQKLAESQNALKKLNEELELNISRRTKELKALVEQSPYAIAIYNSKGILLDVNEEWNKIFKSIDNPIPELEIIENKYLIANGYLQKVKEIIEKGGRLKTEPILFEDKSRMFVFDIYDIKDENSKVSRIVVQLEDRTDEIKRNDINKELNMQKRISSATLDILEQDRNRVAKELHDQIGQKLLLAKLGLEMMQDDKAAEQEKLEDVKQQIIGISKEIRSIVFSLHPVELDNYGLVDAIQLMVRKFADISRIKANINFYGESIIKDRKLELNIYRIIQEALNNITKHAKASKVQIELHFSPVMVRGLVKDNGKGFNINQTEFGTLAGVGYGLISMRERTIISGGEFTISSEPGKGTEILFEIPFKENDEE